MADIGTRVSRATLQRLQGSTGVPSAVAALSVASGIEASPFHPEQVQMVNISPELAEKSAGTRYPLVHIYCERVTNQLREKFRRFSGKVRIAIEARVSQSRLEGIDAKSAFLADAVTEVLDASRGDWENGMFYSGGYEIAFGPVKQGGKNFIQTTKIVFEVDVSSD